jgi:hypothetical protein
VLAHNAERGFPEMLGSIYCMHWAWKNYPFAQQGIYKGHKGSCIVVVEAVEDNDIHNCHAFFAIGMVGSHNDINMLQCSNVFQKLVKGNAPHI